MHGLEHELRQHAGALRALALRLVGPAHADDLVQETSLLAWTQRPDERAGLGAWLRSVLRHRAGKLRRSEGRRRQREGAGTARDDAPSPVDLAAQREAMTALHDALMLLPAPYQGVLLQRFFQDRTPTAIAAAASIPLATVKSQLQRGLALLRERLDAGQRRDWRGAFAGAFALPRPTAPAVAAAAGAMLMSTKAFWIGGAAAAGLMCVVLWPDAGTASPVAVTARERVVAASAADVGDAASEPVQRTAAVAAATAGATPSVPMRIRIVDAFDGSPLPEFTVRLDSGPGNATTRTDARGQTEIDGAWRDQEVTVSAIDDERVQEAQPTHTIRADQWLTGDTCLDVPFAIGPTYRLVFDTAPPDGDLEAELVAGNDATHARGHHRALLRRGPMPWVRFTAASANPSALGDGPWTLVVSGRAWTSSGNVQQVRGTQAAPVQLRGSRCGLLQIAATIDSRPSAEDGALVVASVYPVDDAGKAQNEGGRHLTGEQRQIELAAGKYRVFVLGPDRQVHREDVVIAAATTTIVHAAFRAGGPRFTMQVVLRSQTGKRQVADLPVARRAGGSQFVNAKWKARRDDGALLYELSGLSPGEWDVTIGPTPHLPPWDSTTKRVRADAGTVEFVCLDAGAPPPGHGTVRVLDAATNKPVVGAGVTTVLDGSLQGTQAGDDGMAHLGSCLAGQPVQVLVRAAGYAPAWFQMTPSDDAEAPARDVALSPGWGTLLMVVQPAAKYRGGEPLPGVRVLVDGVFAGTTDARGLFLLSTVARPTRLELQHDDYVHQYGGIDAATGAPDGQTQDPFFVVMEPKKAK